MMTSKEVRKRFLTFFQNKQHEIVPSAPVVVKNDPTLMFTNAGMNQFKDIFLGNKQAKSVRVADTQKCLRVSGKHNDLEEVGVDTYHHTLFEMLGNWSFGDYFKKEAISWAWELLTVEFGIPKDRIYVTIFEGDKEDGTERDIEAYNAWKEWIDEDRILNGDKKDNFWEMGDTGPCGPCSELHVDMRSDEERSKVDGKSLVNEDHPQVIEIWNLVFIQYQRFADKSLKQLPAKHIDTGMGFERLCMVLQNKTATYDTDIFTPIIEKISAITGVKYGEDESTDIAIRVLSDHIRAISFTIADGQLPSNNKAGYVIRRILRRAVRYYYSRLNRKEAMLYMLVEILDAQMGEAFPELREQKDFIAKVIQEEENAFLRTLGGGIKRFAALKIENNIISGTDAFELYDTYGFPIDLTELMASEKGHSVDMPSFKAELEKQKNRSRSATALETGDWTSVNDVEEQGFAGYDIYTLETKLSRFRKVTIKKKDQYQLVLAKTPFYAESGGQVGDTGLLWFGDEKIPVIDTKKENDLIVHFVNQLPKELSVSIKAEINTTKRSAISRNHTATHLLHSSLKQVLGDHVNQKGSLVAPGHLRFDFSHFSKVSIEEIMEVEKIVNAKIRENIPADIQEMSFDEATAKGAMALFGEKYGDKVRVVTFDPDFSMELCGGSHVKATGEIGFCKVTVETSVAAGVRRIEAITGEKAYEHLSSELESLRVIKSMFKNPKNIVGAIEQLSDKNSQLEKDIEALQLQKAAGLKNELKTKVEAVNGVNTIFQKIDAPNADAIKKIAYDLRNEVEDLFCVLGADLNGKANLTIIISDNIVESKELNAGKIIREIAKNVQGGGGGQAFFATAGGKNPDGIEKALEAARKIVND